MRLNRVTSVRVARIVGIQMKRRKLALICAGACCILLFGIPATVFEFDVDSFFYNHRRVMHWCSAFPWVVAISTFLLTIGMAITIAIWIASPIIILCAAMALIGPYAAPTGVDERE